MITSEIKYNKGIKKSSLISLMVNVSILSTVLVQFLIESGVYPVVRVVLYSIFFISFISIAVLSNKKFNKNQFLNFYLFAIYLVTICSLLVSFYKSEITLGTLIEFTLPFMVLYMGYASGLTRTQMSKVILRYMILVTLLGIFIAFVFGNGFQITEQYFFSSKNQVGPFVASVAMMSFIFIVNTREQIDLKLNNKLLIIIFLVNMGSLLALRNRSGLVALGICILVLLLSKIKIKKRFKREVLLMPLVVLIVVPVLLLSSVLNPLVDLIYQSFFMNYNTTDLNSLSAGRFDVYLSAFEFIKLYPIFGEIQATPTIQATPHNFLLNLWLQYGVLGMFPISAFYIFLWLFIMYKIVVKKVFDPCLFLILFMLVISFFEYSYPFSPLTTVSFSWFLLGHYLKNKDVSNAYSDHNLH